jgi:ribosome modulation factor
MDEEYYNWIHPAVNVESESEARDEGYRAYFDGRSRDDNPFNNNEEWELHLAWEEGRSAAAWDD